MPKFQRVRDTETGHEFSTQLRGDHLEVLDDEPAVNAEGKPLPAKPAASKPLEQMTIPELKERIGQLNQGRAEDAQIATTGNKSDLVNAINDAKES